LNIHFSRLTTPTPEVADAFTQWENDPTLIHLTRPNKSQEDLTKAADITAEDLQQRLEHGVLYLIYNQEELVGEMSYQIDPPHLYKQETGTAWIGITIGEESVRGKGLGILAMQHLEEEIRKAGYTRIELGVFEFNTPARKLYTKMGYIEIDRIPNFTFWQDKMWTDIRMEKYL
jgi:RimJ/RimL family protein N-acetyltransferase